MGYTVYIDSNGDPQGNFTLLAARRGRDQDRFGMYPVGSFLLDHSDTKLPVRSIVHLTEGRIGEIDVFLDYSVG